MIRRLLLLGFVLIAQGAVADFGQSASPESTVPILAGNILLKMETFPVGLSGVLLELAEQRQGNWKKVQDLTSAAGGGFSVFTRLYPGRYRIRSLDKRYEGGAEFVLVDQPLTNITVELTKTKISVPQ